MKIQRLGIIWILILFLLIGCDPAPKSNPNVNQPVVPEIEQPAVSENNEGTNTISILAWNVESGGNDPEVIGRQLSELGGYDIFCLSEVAEKNFDRYLNSGGIEFLKDTENPIIAAAEHRRRQLQYRLTEYDSLGRAAGLQKEFLDPPERLKSKNGHLAGIVHAIDERSFEFRCYLDELGWENNFYKRLIRLSQNTADWNQNALLMYGLEAEAEDIVDPKEIEAGLGISFYRSSQVVLTNIQVSDFCTFRVHSIWFAHEPESADDIKSHFTNLLNEVDE